MADRFDKFTERCRHALSLAQLQAQRFRHNYVAPEHLLLALLDRPDDPSTLLLLDLKLDLSAVRLATEARLRASPPWGSNDIGLTLGSKKVIEFAIDAARRLEHRYIGTEHLLLGIVREGSAADLLPGSTIDALRAIIQSWGPDDPDLPAAPTSPVAGLHEPDDVAIALEQAAAGNMDAFGRLYDEYVDRVQRHIYYRVGNTTDAEDLTAQVFINAWKAIGQYPRTGRPFLVWLLRIANNQVIEFYRAQPDRELLNEP